MILKTIIPRFSMLEYFRRGRLMEISMLGLLPLMMATIGVMLLRMQGLSGISLLVLIGIPLGILLFFNPVYVLLASIASLYFYVDAFYLKVAVWSSFAVLLSYAVNVRSSNKSSAHNPLFKPYLLLLAAVAPSLYNTIHIELSMITMINMVSMTAMAFAVSRIARDYSVIAKAARVYLGFALLNGMWLIYESASTSRRVFGFSGIVYVDYVCIAILIATILMVALRRRYFLRLAMLILFFVLALLFTQTRNTIISLAASAGFLLFFLYRHSVRFQIDRKKLLAAAVISAAVIAASVLVMLVLTPQLFERIMDLGAKQSLEIRNEYDFARNSMVTRLLIWHTTLNAFLQHPFIGIGLYAFPFDSKYYFSIPPALYKLFVQGLSPHETFFAVLAETGILGFTGFVFFLTSLIITGKKSIERAHSDIQLHYSLGLLVIQIYILCSMFLTDAWLWGQCGVLWSIVIGLTLANYAMINQTGWPDAK